MSFTYKDLFKLLTFPFLVYMFNSTFQTMAFDFYYKYSVDTLSHFLGGLAMAYSASYALSLIEKRGWIVIKKDILRVGVVVGAVMTIAVLWEFYEFIYDLYMWGPVAQPSVADTVKDLSLGIIGALVFCLFTNFKIGKRAD